MKREDALPSTGAAPLVGPLVVRGAETVLLQTDRSAVSAYLAEIGRKGGLKGGKARAAKLSARARKRIAAKAARSRWASSRKYS